MTTEQAGLSIRALTGADRETAIESLARLRIAVFREWPYLYDGSLEYERDYLAEFSAEAGSVLIVAEDEETGIVGAATASPMAGQKAEFRAPLEAQGVAVDDLFYFGESVLLPEWRGKGIGHAFFDEREAAAREAGANAACFCAVIRPDHHALQPRGARDLHPFWRVRGYAPVEGAIAHFAWQDVDQPEETEHPMQFWMRRLG